MTDFTFEITIDPRFRDLDPNGHVNQAVYFSYLEQARVRYWRDVLARSHAEEGLAMVHQEIDYTRPILVDDRVTVRQRIEPLGTSSYPMVYEIHTEEARAADAEIVLTAYDREAVASIPIPQPVREGIERFEGH